MSQGTDPVPSSSDDQAVGPSVQPAGPPHLPDGPTDQPSGPDCPSDRPNGPDGPPDRPDGPPDRPDGSPDRPRGQDRPRPPSGAPPTYEEAANHPTLEYGGFLVPFEARSTASPIGAQSLSFSHMSLQRAGRDGSRAVELTPRDQRLADSRGMLYERPIPAAWGDGLPPGMAVSEDQGGGGVDGSSEDTGDKCMNLLLPPMHICIATTCLVFNCVIPGFGTLVASFALFCCTKPGEYPCYKKVAACCLGLLVALAQLILTPIFLIGWIWSILWGFAFVGVSHQDYHGIKDEDDELENDPIITSAIRRTRRVTPAVDDEAARWSAVGSRRYAAPSSAPSRRSSVAVVPSHFEYDRRASVLRATRSYGHVEVYGLHYPHCRPDRHRVLAGRYIRPLPSVHRPGSGGSISTTHHRPPSETTLTSYINEGTSVLQPSTTREPAPLATVDM